MKKLTMKDLFDKKSYLQNLKCYCLVKIDFVLYQQLVFIVYSINIKN